MEYKIIIGFDGIDDFEKRVNEELSKGWKLQGGVHVTSKQVNYGKSNIQDPLVIFHQAIIRENAAQQVAQRDLLPAE